MNRPHVSPPLRISTNVNKLLARRTTVDWNVTVGHQTKGCVRGCVVNVSITGLLMQIPASYPHGAVVEVVLRPVPHELIHAVVQIIRVDPQTDGSFLYGACFTRLEDAGYYLLREKILMRQDQFVSDFAARQCALTAAG